MKVRTLTKELGLILISVLCIPLVVLADTDPNRLPGPVARELGQEVSSSRHPFTKCSGEFALCAFAECITLDNVAYCKCVVENGESISLTFSFDDKETGEEGDVCDLLAQGSAGGYTVSTYSPPERMLKSFKGPDRLAIYTCNDGSGNLSAQCDGGLCFDSTRGKEFPFFGDLGKDEIICSCPIAKSGSRIGFQILGPTLCKAGEEFNPSCCDETFQDRFCHVKSSFQTGTRMVVGALSGSGSLLTFELLGDLPPLNRCEPSVSPSEVSKSEPDDD